MVGFRCKDHLHLLLCLCRNIGQQPASIFADVFLYGRKKRDELRFGVTAYAVTPLNVPMGGARSRSNTLGAQPEELFP